MGALTSSRKRSDGYCGGLPSWPPPLAYFYPNDHHQFHTPPAKKPRLSTTNGSLDPMSPVGSSVSRLTRYPEPTSQLRREVHAPCRKPKFGSKLRHEISGETTTISNCEVRYEKARSQLLSLLHTVHIFPRKAEKAADSKPDRDEDIVVISDDSSVEVIENVEDGHEGVSVISKQGLQETNGFAFDSETLVGAKSKILEDRVDLASSSGLSGMVRVEDPVKMIDSLSLSPKCRDDNVPLHKKLLQSASRSDSRLSRLQSDISFQEKIWKSLIALRPVKKQVEEEEEDSAYSALLKEAFVPLTEADEKTVVEALSYANRRKILVTHEDSNIEITGEVLQCLKPRAWLNDEVINLYLELLKERERRQPKKFLKCHFFSTFFYRKLTGGRNGYDYKSVRRWTTLKKLGYGLNECDKIFVPIHKEVHWCLAVINHKDKKFQYLDSLGGRDSQVARVLARYFVDEVKDKSSQEIDVGSWEGEFVDDLPVQENGWDCGVFMIKYADFYSRGLGLDFSQEHMPYFRMRTAKEILQLKAD